MLTRRAQAWASIDQACNLLITCTMSYILWRARLRSRAKSTISLLSKIITLVIETGLATTVSGTFGIALVFAYKQTTLYAIPMFMLSKLYSNSLLAVWLHHVHS